MKILFKNAHEINELLHKQVRDVTSKLNLKEMFNEVLEGERTLYLMETKQNKTQ